MHNFRFVIAPIFVKFFFVHFGFFGASFFFQVIFRPLADFLASGEIDIERYRSNGKIYGESVLEELFALCSDTEAPPAEAANPGATYPLQGRSLALLRESAPRDA